MTPFEAVEYNFPLFDNSWKILKFGGFAKDAFQIKMTGYKGQKNKEGMGLEPLF